LAPNFLEMRITSPAVKYAGAAVFVSILFLAAFAQRPATGSSGEVLDPPSRKTDLYRTDADAKNEIVDALKRASAGHKRVLLVFGANWCYDCHVLDHALHDEDAGKIVRENYLLVHVNIGEGEKNPELVKQYKIPLDKGVPAVAILDSSGKLLYSSGEGEFEAARRMMKKDLVAFLNQWKETRP
jgi:thiol:disulfide interchange protein